MSITVTADDGNDGTVSDTFDIVVANTNDAPTVANPIANQSATQGQSFDFSFPVDAFDDIDVGDTLTYSAELAGGGALPAWLSFDAPTRTFSGTPANDDVGTVSITVTADDGNGATVADTFDIVVAGVNDAPVITVPLTIALDEDTGAALTGISFADIDAGSNAVTATFSVSDGAIAATSGSGVTVGGTATSLTLTGSLADLNAFIAASGLSYTPAADFFGTRTLTVVIDDGGHSGLGGAQTDSATLTLSIAAVNDAPVNNVPGNQQIDAGASLVFDVANGNAVSIADVDAGSESPEVSLTATHGTLTLSTITGLGFTTGDGNADANLLFTGTLADINAALAGLSFTPTPGFVGSASIEITTNDRGYNGSGGALTDTDTFAIEVIDPNTAPVFTSPESAEIDENLPAGALVYTAVASDPDTDQTLTFSLTGEDAAAFTIDEQTGEVRLVDSPDFETKSSYAFSVTVLDDALVPGSATQAVVLTVRDLNEAPVFVSGSAVAVAENAPVGTVIYTASALDPDAGQALRYELAGPDAGAFTIDPLTGAVTLRRGLDHESKPRYDFVVRAIDDASLPLSASQAVTLQVLDVNEAPQILGLPERPMVVTVGEALALPDLRITDPDGDRLLLELTATGGRLEGPADLDPGRAGLQLAGSPAELAVLLADLRFVAQTDGPASVAVAVSDPLGLDAAGSYRMFAVVPPAPEPPVDSGPPDTDDDGIPDAIESLVPRLPRPGIAQGDGNGDGFQDGDQAGVASQPLLRSARPDSAPDGTPATWVTLVAGGVDGKLAGSGGNPISGFSQSDRPDSAPALPRAPLGELSFSASGLESGESLSFSLYLDAAAGANGFWVQDENGIWTNLAARVRGGEMDWEAGRVRLDFEIADGGPFDADRQADGKVSVVGVAGAMPLSLAGHLPDPPPDGFFWF